MSNGDEAGRRNLVVDIPRPGGLDALLLADRPIPRPAAGEVLIEVHAAGVNRADIKQRAGDYPMPAHASTVPGLEVSGEVVQLGPGVTQWREGDRVCALVVDGGYARYCVAPAVQCLPIPRGLDAIQAAALPEAIFTVWTALFEQAGLQGGERVLIHGGAGGIGTTAIQLAAAFGAQVYATAGSQERCALCVGLGALAAFNYREVDFVQATLDRTEGRGVDVVLDMVGGSYAPRNLRALAQHGRLCFIAGDESQDVTFTVREITLKRAVITGTTLRHRSVEDKGRIAGIVREKIWPLIEAGRIRPRIDRVVPLSQVARAHEAMEQGAVAGKIVLLVREPA
jgi:putative PIG3 family NAD(P)H quinone oxidoreductase